MGGLPLPAGGSVDDFAASPVSPDSVANGLFDCKEPQKRLSLSLITVGDQGDQRVRTG